MNPLTVFALAFLGGMVAAGLFCLVMAFTDGGKK